MRTILKMMSLAVVALLLASSMAVADERAEIADLQARIAALEGKMMAPAAGGDAESLSVAKGKGMLKIMGDAKIRYKAIHMEERNLGKWTRRTDPNNRMGGAGGAVGVLAEDGNLGAFDLDNVNAGDNIDYTGYEWDASLKFRVDAGPDAYLNMKLDLEDANDTDDLVEEVYFHWSKIRGSNWSVRLGKQEMPFGQDHCALITDPFVHGNSSILMDADYHNAGTTVDLVGTASQLAQWDTATTTSGGTINDTRAAMGFDRGGANPHVPHGVMPLMGIGETTTWIIEPDNQIGVAASYKYKELATLELASFDTSGGADGGMKGDFHEDGPNDNFQSYSARLTLTPVEGLEMEMSFINLHNEGNGDPDEGNAANNGAMFINPAAGDYMKPDQQAFSLGFTYDIAPIKSMVFGEYIYNNNLDWYDDVNADIWQLGLEHQLTSKIMLAGWWEMARIDNGFARKYARACYYGNSDGNDATTEVDPRYNGRNDQGYALFDKDINETIQRIGLGGEYKCDNGITFKLEYLYEWYSNSLSWYDDADAHQVTFQTSYKF
jgi:hypothetical protein